MASQNFDSNVLTVAAVKGVNTSTPTGAPPQSIGVEGQSDLGVAVAGHSISGFGVHGISQNNFGVRAESTSGVGLRATSVSGRAIEATADQNGIGVAATSKDGAAVVGISETGFGLSGRCLGLNHAIHGESDAGRGVVGVSQTFVGVTGESTSSDGVFGSSVSGIGVHGKGGSLAGFFEGDIQVTGKVDCPASTIHCFELLLANADCAEEFDIQTEHKVDPGTVMVLSGEGGLLESHKAYDRRVAGVISGAGDYKPAIILDNRRTTCNRQPIALVGKVFCKADAQFGSIEVGDLLTTSPTIGHAMKTTDPQQAFGAVIGKALRPLADGQGLIPILISLQ